MKLVPRLGDQDALIERLALNIRGALGDAEPSASVYVDYLARALSAHLLRAHRIIPVDRPSRVRPAN